MAVGGAQYKNACNNRFVHTIMTTGKGEFIDNADTSMRFRYESEQPKVRLPASNDAVDEGGDNASNCVEKLHLKAQLHSFVKSSTTFVVVATCETMEKTPHANYLCGGKKTTKAEGPVSEDNLGECSCGVYYREITMTEGTATFL